MKDTFSYEARWDSVGLDCSYCMHFRAPSAWPDVNREVACRLHRKSLAIELGPDNYKRWEWFCRDFVDSGGAYPPAVEHLEDLRSQLSAGVLYRLYGPQRELLEYDIASFPQPAGSV